MLSERIRLATAVQHRALEEDLDLMGPSLTVDTYLRTLELFFGFISRWEPIAEKVYAQWYADRRKLPLLRADLHFLGLDSTDIAAIPLAEAEPEWETYDGLLGSLYVMEGSTLGGQYISRHLESVLGFRDGNGYSYYRGYGKQTGARWKAFVARLNAEGTEENEQRIIDGAIATFSAVHRWLTSGARVR